MLHMKTIKTCCAVLAVLGAVPWATLAQDQGAEAIRKKLESEYQLTKTTDDKSDIVTAGSVIVLHKDKVLMVAATSSANPCMNTYRDGKISPTKACGVGEKLRRLPGFGSHVPGAGSAPATRNFVSGEKFWVTKIDVRGGKEPGIVFDFFTDSTPSGDNGIRYKGALIIPLGAITPTPEEALKAVADVITVAPSEDAKDADKGSDKAKQQAPQEAKQQAPQGGQQQASAAPPSQPADPPAAAPQGDAPPAPIEPPPPPPPDPTEVSEGQTIDQVVSALGQPQKKAKVGTKDIYYYKDLKVTFVNGKVKDVQ
jgi:hypothetical protein